MTDFLKNIAAAAEQAVADGADQTVAKTGGSSEPPAAGPCNLRLVGYVELGKHEKTVMGKTKTQELVTLIFELSGRNHPPIVTDSGTFPHRIELTENLSLNEKARFFKLFGLLNYKGTAKHMTQLLGQAFRGKVIHREYTPNGGQKRIAAELYDKKLGVFTIMPPRVDVYDGDGQPTGEVREVKVDPAISPIRAFLWNYATKEQWDSLFIDGEYEERRNEAGEVTAPAKSKNKYQLKIAAALNYKGSVIERLLKNDGAELELPADGVVDDIDTPDDDDTPPAKPAAQAAKPAAKATKGAAKGDPLAGIADE